MGIIAGRKVVCIEGTAREALTGNTLQFHHGSININGQTRSGTLQAILRDLLLEPDPHELFGRDHVRCRRCGALVALPFPKEDSDFQKTVGPLCENCRIKLGVF